MVRGKVILNTVSQKVVVSQASFGSAFIGATSTTPSSHYVFTHGVLEGYKFLCMFRVKIWWMISCIGNYGCKIPVETQILLLEVKEESALHDHHHISSSDPEYTFYILLSPVLDGKFRLV